MKKTIVLFFFLFGTYYCQYQIKSPYLSDPSRIIGYVDSCASFWLKSYDNTNGGFYTNVGRTGAPLFQWGRNKNMMTQSRNAYGMTRAYMLTGDKRYLDKARQALNFMYEHAWDKTYSGWYNEIGENGVPLNPSENKTAFYQHYALLGIMAYYEATGDTTDYQWLMKGYTNNESKLWDSRQGYEGYYDYASADWKNKNNKSFNSTVDAITTHALYLYLLTNNEIYKSKLQSITANMLDHLYFNMVSQKIGFPEDFDSNWNIRNTNDNMTIMGHVLKTAWCLGRMYQLDPQQKYLDAAKALVQNVLDKGYDHQYGGPYKDFNRITGQMLMWGQRDTAKAWWQMEQAVMAGLELYDLTKDDIYLKMADETLDFFMKYFVDHIYGEVYSDRTKQGGSIWGDEKGNGNKGAYHSIETGYYVYLYGSLFFQNTPVTLYYNFIKDNKEREIPLYPLAIPDSKLIITSVEHEGQPYNDFNSASRILKIHPEDGGEFKVTFRNTGISYASELPQLPERYELQANYPNPFNPSTTIAFELPETKYVDLRVYDLLGREIVTLVQEELTAGRHTAVFDAAGLSSGTYICRITAGNFSSAIKMALVK